MWAFTWEIRQRSDDSFTVSTAITSEIRTMGERAPRSVSEYPSMDVAVARLQKYVQGGDTVLIFAPDGALVWKYDQPGMSGY